MERRSGRADRDSCEWYTTDLPERRPRPSAPSTSRAVRPPFRSVVSPRRRAAARTPSVLVRCYPRAGSRLARSERKPARGAPLRGAPTRRGTLWRPRPLANERIRSERRTPECSRTLVHAAVPRDSVGFAKESGAPLVCCSTVGAPGVRRAALAPASPTRCAAVVRGRYLVDPASSHMLVSKIKPCMCKYEQIQTVKLRMAH